MQRDLAPFGRHRVAPEILYLIEVDGGIIAAGDKPEPGRRQPPERREHGIGCDDAIALSEDERDAGVEQLLLRDKNFERRPLTGLGFFSYAVKRTLGRGDLRLRC